MDLFVYKCMHQIGAEWPAQCISGSRGVKSYCVKKKSQKRNFKLNFVCLCLPSLAKWNKNMLKTTKAQLSLEWVFKVIYQFPINPHFCVFL